jgi:hypothetical protein
LFNILIDFDDISIGHNQGLDVQKLNFDLDVYMQTTMILEQLGAQGMEDICGI